MDIQSEITHHQPESLGSAREMAHKAVQLVTKAARANLDAVSDDSHSNLSWDNERGAFLSQPLLGKDREVFVGLAISSLALLIVDAGQTLGELQLAGATDGEACAWLDAQLAQLDLAPASQVSLPYDLPQAVDQVGDHAGYELAGGLSGLSAWFTLANLVLTDFIKTKSDIDPGPSPVRCWPHHFDIATYVGLEAGDFETARGIGVGMSPGDDSYGEPYFYINPWPHLNPAELPDLPKPGHWHTQGFVGAIATATEVFPLTDIEAHLRSFVDRAFSIGREQPGV